MSDIILMTVRAFLVGGFLCLVAQLLIDLTSLTPARILVLYVCSGVLLGALGLYEPLFEFAGAGVSVPIMGFGGIIARGVREAFSQEGLMASLSAPFSAAAVGISSALVFGYICALVFRSRPKKL